MHRMIAIFAYSIRVQENLYIQQNEFNLATKPFLEGIRLNMGVDAIIVSQNRFQGQLDQGKADLPKFYRICKDYQAVLLQTVLNGSTLHYILQYLIHASTCSNHRQQTFPELYGIQLSLNKPTCAISYIRMCTWFVSESFSCKRWQELTENDFVRVVIDSYFLEQVRIRQLLQEMPSKEIKLDLVEMAGTFLFTYMNQTLENDISGQRSTSDSVNRFTFISLVIVLLAVSISVFTNSGKNYSVGSDQPEIYDQQLNSEEDQKYIEMGRKGMLQMLASGGLIDEI